MPSPTVVADSVPSQAMVKGPKGLPRLGMLVSVHRDPMGFLLRCAREFGDTVGFNVYKLPVLLFSHPRDVEKVLVTQAGDFQKSVDFRVLYPLLGNGLLSSESEFWKAQRRRIQPSFHPERIAEYAALMTECVEDIMRPWQDGQAREIHNDMVDLTRDVVCRVLFGSAKGRNSQTLSKAVTTVFSEMKSDVFYFPFLRKVRGTRTYRWFQAIRNLDAVIYEIIAEKRAAGYEGNDLLRALLRAQDDDGSTMTDANVRDEVMTLFLAGHETSAIVLAWAMYLLATHPEAQERAAAECQAVLGDRRPHVNDLTNLPYLKAVLQETMRMYPPIWSLAREALRDTTISGVPVPAGTQVWMCVRNIQRDPRWFSDPDEFRPERFEQTPSPWPRFAYVPFGAGARMCIGHGFAMTEMLLALSMILREYRVRMAPGAKVEMMPWLTLRPSKKGVPVILERRRSGP